MKNFMQFLKEGVNKTDVQILVCDVVHSGSEWTDGEQFYMFDIQVEDIDIDWAINELDTVYSKRYNQHNYIPPSTEYRVSVKYKLEGGVVKNPDENTTFYGDNTVIINLDNLDELGDDDESQFSRYMGVLGAGVPEVKNGVLTFKNGIGDLKSKSIKFRPNDAVYVLNGSGGFLDMLKKLFVKSPLDRRAIKTLKVYRDKKDLY